MANLVDKIGFQSVGRKVYHAFTVRCLVTDFEASIRSCEIDFMSRRNFTKFEEVVQVWVCRDDIFFLCRHRKRRLDMPTVRLRRRVKIFGSLKTGYHFC